MNSKTGYCLAIVATVACVAGLMHYALAPVPTAPSDDQEIGKDKSKSKTEVRSSHSKTNVVKITKLKKTKPTKRPPQLKPPKDWFESLPNAADRAIGKRIQDALDADKKEDVFSAVEAALESKNEEVRRAAVDALCLQGADAMPYLLKFVTDQSKDVSDAAYRAWDDAVDTVDGDLNKFAQVKTALSVLKDEEHVKTAVGKIEMFDQSRAIRELAKLARGEGKAAEAAKESYENVTGEPFESWAAAELKAIAIDRDNQE